MNKRQFLHITVSLTLLTLSGCATGMASSDLISSSQFEDPRVVSYNAAFSGKNDVFLDYSVEDVKNDKQRRYADRYWAQLHLNKLNDNTGIGDYTVKRYPMPQSLIEQLIPIPIIDLNSKVEPATDGYRKNDDTFKYIHQQPETTLPQVFVLSGSSYLQIYVRYRDEKSNKIEVYQSEPGGPFIPTSQYLKIVMLYPFALVADIVTLPLYLIFSHGR